MDVERIRQLRLAQPFKPFALILEDGRRLPVKQPYFLAIGMDGRRISVATGGEGFEFFPPERVRDVEVASSNDG